MSRTEVKITMFQGCDDLLPLKAHENDAAYDLRAREGATLYPRKVVLVPTGLYIELPRGFEAQVRPRSGLAAKHNITVWNSPGTIDSGYRGEVSTILYNGGDKPYHIKRGERISQMVITKLPEIELKKVEKLNDSQRGDGGFGSTGKH